MNLIDNTEEIEKNKLIKYYDFMGRRIYVTKKDTGPSIDQEPLKVMRLMIIVSAMVGVAVTIFHEFTYRQTGGNDFPVLKIISHAGGDMLMVLSATIAAMIGVLLLVQSLPKRGIK